MTRYAPGMVIGGTTLLEPKRRENGNRASGWFARCDGCGKIRIVNPSEVRTRFEAGKPQRCHQCAAKARGALTPRDCRTCHTTRPERFRHKKAECMRCERRRQRGAAPILTEPSTKHEYEPGDRLGASVLVRIASHENGRLWIIRCDCGALRTGRAWALAHTVKRGYAGRCFRCTNVARGKRTPPVAPMTPDELARIEKARAEEPTRRRMARLASPVRRAGPVRARIVAGQCARDGCEVAPREGSIYCSVYCRARVADERRQPVRNERRRAESKARRQALTIQPRTELVQ